MAKKIIIDGVDVSKCKFNVENNERYTTYIQYTNMCYDKPYDNCENKPDCYYKQLKRLELENKKLKKDLEFYPFVEQRKEEEKQSRIHFEKLSNKYKSEVEKLKEKIKIYKDVGKDIKEKYKDRCCNLFLIYPDLRKSCFYSRYIKLKSAIKEIDKIITPTILIGGLELSADKVEQIQDIIAKAKGEE